MTEPTTTLRYYRGFSIDRSPYGGYWRTFIPDYGWLKADTLEGLKTLITLYLRLS